MNVTNEYSPNLATQTLKESRFHMFIVATIGICVLLTTILTLIQYTLQPSNQDIDTIRRNVRNIHIQSNITWIVISLCIIGFAAYNIAQNQVNILSMTNDILLQELSSQKLISQDAMNKIAKLPLKHFKTIIQI
tara:strand:+ start:2640 stop:3041 length:402 start_codon:yes stop_codon:yes gene_type:complete